MGTVFRLTGDKVLPAAGQRIIKAGDVALLLEAQDILDQARERAANIILEAEKVYALRHAEGYQDGKAEGKLELAEKMMETVLSSVDFIEGIESNLVNIVGQAIRKIIGDLDDNDCIVRVVRTALGSVRNQQHVTIRVAPADAEAVSQDLAAMLQSSPDRTSFLDVLPDPRLEKGACLLESELGVLDASLEIQLKAMEKALQSRINT